MAGERDIHYRAEVRSMGFEDAPALPIYHLMLHEHRAGGWTGVLDLRPRVDTEGEAFDAVIGAGPCTGDRLRDDTQDEGRAEGADMDERDHRSDGQGARFERTLRDVRPADRRPPHRAQEPQGVLRLG